VRLLISRLQVRCQLMPHNALPPRPPLPRARDPHKPTPPARRCGRGRWRPPCPFQMQVSDFATRLSRCSTASSHRRFCASGDLGEAGPHAARAGETRFVRQSRATSHPRLHRPCSGIFGLCRVAAQLTSATCSAAYRRRRAALVSAPARALFPASALWRS
jgi:hypothetical protein